ncbi:MAG: class I SAM-dependent methyltransferase [Aphanocapsa sp. GSE-SYN-MK-11-07L]|jgi:cyclopropane fatty-acyl-phospholipid synthase-like methyltransferase|nr:class I SAM-dependent methyltransferase [Aphanocapsa sp. GSE-SYN-MK-11-07L]
MTHPFRNFHSCNNAASAGKTVLRPGGKLATEQLFSWANFQPGETVLELASGLGTSAIALAKRYGVHVTGIEQDSNRVAIAQHRVRSQGLAHQVNIVQGNIFELEQISQQFDSVVAEAILTMQSSPGKAKILQGVYGCLQPGGRFLGHELLARDHEAELHQVLSAVNRVNATPLSIDHWMTTLAAAGLQTQHRQTGAMRLLHLPSLIQDEGLANTLKIFSAIATRPKLRSRVFAMRQVFQTYQQDLGYLIFAAIKS